MKEINIKVPRGIQYISQWSSYVLPKGHVIVDKGVTGCGYTEYCLTNKDNIILCSPRKLLLENKRDQHLGDLNILYLENNVENFQGVQDIKDKIKDHIFNCLGPFGGLPCKIMVTYDSSHYVIDVLNELGLLDGFTFIVDEFQSIFLDSYFKSEVELDFVEVLQDCPNVLYLSATPMLRKYLEKLPEFKDLDFYSLDWSDTGYVENIRIKRRRVKSLGEECGKIINKYLAQDYPVSLNLNGKPVESKEAVFYFNSVNEIVRIIKKTGLTSENTKVICSDTLENQKKLKKIGFQISRVPVPSKGDINPMFMFCTSSVYMGVDFYSDCASTYVFANPNIRSLALDISLDLPQIVGRQRTRENPFKNDVVIFYKISSKSWQNKNEFDRLQQQRREETKELLNLYISATDKQRDAYLKKLRKDIPASKYSDDFVGISRLTNKPVYNTLIEIASERSWEVAQEDYQDNINVTRALEDQGYKVDIFKSSEEIKIQDFLDNHFYRTGIFAEKMKMYCEFRDSYENNREIIDILNHKIQDSKYKNYYEYYGTSGCRAVSYKEDKLYKGWKDKAKEDELVIAITSTFHEGDKYSLSEIKQILNEINIKLGIASKAKASDLGNYFKLTRTKKTMPDKSVKEAFKIGPKI